MILIEKVNFFPKDGCKDDDGINDECCEEDYRNESTENARILVTAIKEELHPVLSYGH